VIFVFLEHEVIIEDVQIDFQLDNVPFMDGQQLSETCTLYESPQTPVVKEESERLQHSSELH
jgi:hypothetical protein